MKRIIIFLILIESITTGVFSNNLPDFAVSDIIVHANKFICIKISNNSNINFQIKPELNETIFLILYINKIERAEYKLKYIDKKLFTSNSTIFFKTNFRAQPNLNVKAEVNREKIIPESNYINNFMEKNLSDDVKR